VEFERACIKYDCMIASIGLGRVVIFEDLLTDVIELVNRRYRTCNLSTGDHINDQCF
jgi:hypothetical protein